MTASPTRIKTTELLFPLAIPDEWLNTLKRVWNSALNLLYWRQYQVRLSICGEQPLPTKLEVRKPVIYNWDAPKEKIKPEELFEGYILDGSLPEETEFNELELGALRNRSVLPLAKAKKTELDELCLVCPIGRVERIDKTKSWDKKNLIWRPFKWEVQPVTGYLSCPLDADRHTYAWDGAFVRTQWMNESPLKSYDVIELRKPFAQKRCNWLGSIPQVYVNDFLEDVANAWARYQKGDMGKPKFKGKRDRVDTVPCQSFRGQGTLQSNRLTIPGFKLVSWVEASKYPQAHVSNKFFAALYDRVIEPLERVAEAMRKNPHEFENLQERLDEGDRYKEVLELLERGDDLPNVEFPLGAEIKEANDLISKYGEIDALIKLEKKISRAKPEKANRLRQVSNLLCNHQPFPEPDPLRAEVREAQKTLTEKGLAEAIKKLKERIEDRELEASITHLTTPGSFRLTRREGQTYIQIAHLVLQTVQPADRAVGIDVGLRYMYVSTSGVAVKNADFTKQDERIKRLQQVLSKKKHGSSNYRKVSDKIRRIEGRIKRSKRKRQEYHASWQTDVNGAIAIKYYSQKEAVSIPIPRPDEKGETYLPNGRTKTKERNERVSSAALGQFVALIKQKSQDKGRDFKKVEVKVTASEFDVLAAAQFEQQQALTQQRTKSRKIQAKTPKKANKVRRKRKSEKAIG